MGTYGPGEIRALCEWLPPEVAVHHRHRARAPRALRLDRRHRRGQVRDLRTARDVAVAQRRRPAARRRRRCARRPRRSRCGGAASQRAAEPDVVVVPAPDGATRVVRVDGAEHPIASATATHPSNVACAVAVARELGVPVDGSLRASIASRCRAPARGAHVRPRRHRASTTRSTRTRRAPGRALDLLARVGAAGRRVVVTPGMVELGPEQDEENEPFARAARRGRRPTRGRRPHEPAPRCCAAHGTASTTVELRREPRRGRRVGARHLDAGDAVLYENDLPDHYP